LLCLLNSLHFLRCSDVGECLHELSLFLLDCLLVESLLLLRDVDSIRLRCSILRLEARISLCRPLLLEFSPLLELFL
jgi:hypothetical protein